MGRRITFEIAKEDFKKALDLKDGKTPIPGVDFPLPQDGPPGPPGKSIVGPPGKDADPLDPREVIEEIKKLKGDERLDISHLRNSHQLLAAIGKINGVKFNKKDQRWHGGGISAITAGANITITETSPGHFTIAATGSSSVTTTKQAYTTAGGVQIVTLLHTPIEILEVVINGQVQNPADSSVAGNDVTINLANVPSGRWAMIVYTY